MINETIDTRLSSIYLLFILYPCPLNILFLLHYFYFYFYFLLKSLFDYNAILANCGKLAIAFPTGFYYYFYYLFFFFLEIAFPTGYCTISKTRP